MGFSTKINSCNFKPPMVQSIQQHYSQILEIANDNDKIDFLFQDLSNILTVQEKLDILMVYGKRLKIKKEECDVETDVEVTMDITDVHTTNITKDVLKAMAITKKSNSNLICISNRLFSADITLKSDKEARQCIDCSFDGCCLFDYSDELDVNHILAILQVLNKRTLLVFLSSIPLNMLPRQIKVELNKFSTLPKVVQWNSGFIMENVVHYYILLSKNAKEKVFSKLLRKLPNKRILVYTSPNSFHFKMNQLTGNGIEAAYIGLGKSVFVEQFVSKEKHILVTTEKNVVGGDFMDLDLILNLDGTKEGTKSYLYRTGRFKGNKHLVLNMITEQEFKLIKGKPIGCFLQPLQVQDLSKIDVAINQLIN
eukprot:NODE_745_length_4601_cov_0.319636.p1 type:complete len:367 gc:universal NODE_745_length_4601_cov_0.319636:3848-2748(-)